MSGGSIVQAILSSAAGLNTIKYNDDEQLESREFSPKLDWTASECGMRLTNTVCVVSGCVGGIDKAVMETFTFDPAAFERDFSLVLDEEIPSLYFPQTLNKIVVYDIKETNTLANVSPTTYTTTFEVNRPTLPHPF